MEYFENLMEHLYELLLIDRGLINFSLSLHLNSTKKAYCHKANQKYKKEL
jgi:hypothetical protein